MLHYFRVSKNVRDKRRGDSRFSVENFLSHSKEKLRRGTLLCCVSEIFRLRKNLWIKGGKSRFSVKFFVSLPKNFVGEPFGVSLISGIENFYASEGSVTIFCTNLFVSQCQKIS